MARKVAIYARVSTEHEAQINALGNQIQYYDNLLAQHPDWEMYDRYIDEGITGTSTKKRPNFLRMMEDAKKHKFDLIVTREVSRFARNTVDTLIEVRRLKSMKVEVYFVDDNIWTIKDEDCELRLTIMASLAQNESKKTSQRVKAGQRISFENGVFYGTGNIIGYDKVGKDMIVNEKQAEIVKFIYKEFLNGKGSGEIRMLLEQKGYPTATGLKKWATSSVVRILRNSFYCGTIVYRKEYVEDYLEQKKRKNKGEVEQVIVEGKHTPIISKEDFNRVQQLLDEHQKKVAENKLMGKPAAINMWSKRLKCSCGSSFSRRKNNILKDGTVAYSYKCSYQKNSGSYVNRLKKGMDTTNACNIKEVPEWKLIIVANTVYSILLREKPKLEQAIDSALESTIKELYNKKELDKALTLIDNKIQAFKTKKKNLLDVLVSKLITKEEFQEEKETIDEDIKKAEAEKLALISLKGLPTHTIQDRIDELKEGITKSLYKIKGDFSEEFILKYTKQIVIQEDYIEWHLNYLKRLRDMRKKDKAILSSKGDDEILFCNLEIDKDDIIKYKDCIVCKSIKIKEPIKVKIYI